MFIWHSVIIVADAFCLCRVAWNLGVILEIAAAPLLHTAYITAFVFSLANLLLLYARVQTEDRALQQSVGAVGPAPVAEP